MQCSSQVYGHISFEIICGIALSKVIWLANLKGSESEKLLISYKPEP